MPRVTVRRKGTGKREKETRMHPHADAAPRSSFDTDSSPACLSRLASRVRSPFLAFIRIYLRMYTHVTAAHRAAVQP